MIGNLAITWGYHDLKKEKAPPVRQAGMTNAEWEGAQLGAEASPAIDLFLAGVPTLAVYGLVLWGSRTMQAHRNRSLALAAAGLAMVPCGPAFLIGVPVGIWSLIVLNDPAVIDRFDREDRHRDRRHRRRSD